MKMKGFVSLLLLAAMMLLALSFVGCSKKQPEQPGKTDENTGTSGTESGEETDEWGQQVVDGAKFENLDFEGKTVNILIRPAEHYRREFAVEDPQNTVEQRIFERDNYVQRTLNVTFKYLTDDVLHYTDENVSKFVTRIQTAYLGGSDEEKVHIFGAASTLTALPTVQGFLCNLAETEYLDFDMPYWNQTFVENVRINGKLYNAVGDANLSAFDRALVVFANQNMLKANDIDQNIYQTVWDGDWTMERMKEYITAFGYVDSDNNGVISENDVVGLACAYNSEFCDGWLAAAGIHLLQLQDNEFSVDTSQFMKLDTVITRALDIRKAEGSFVTNNYLNKFVNSEALFSFDVLHTTNDRLKRLKDMGANTYAILPLPKYEAGTDLDYGTVPQDQYSTFCMIDYGNRDEANACSAVLDMLSYYNYSKVRPYYVENILKIRFSDDNIACQTMGLIMDSLKFDTAIFYNLQLDSLTFKMTRGCIIQEVAVTTQWASIKSVVEDKLLELNDRFFAK